MPLALWGLLVFFPGAATAEDGDALEPGEVSGQQAPGEQRRARGRTRPAWQTHLSASAGMRLLQREFEFSDPVVPKNPTNYISGWTPAVVLGARAYPMASLGGPLADFGITFEYYRALQLKAQMAGHKEPLDTTLQNLEVGLTFRWNILSKDTSPMLESGLGYGWQEFTIHDPEDNPVPMPDLSYQYLWLRILAGRVPFVARGRGFRVGVKARLDYMFVLAAGDMELTDSGGYGAASMGGLDVRAGLYIGYSAFEAEVSFFYRRIWFDFDNDCFNTSGCNLAGGALDQYTGVLLSFQFSR